MKVAWFKDPDGNIINIINKWPAATILHAGNYSCSFFCISTLKNSIYKTTKAKAEAKENDMIHCKIDNKLVMLLYF
jgi:hypothetical protein